MLGRQKDGPGVGLPYLADLYYLGQLSGLAFAGANWRPLEGDRGPGIGDAILRGLEVTGLNLGSTQLVALPACDTGRGPLINGEGVLGLQRAFEVAGARSVLASLWKVDDNATHALMEEFYEALWAGRTATGGPISKIEALRQAQVMMIHRYDVGTKTIRLRASWASRCHSTLRKWLRRKARPGPTSSRLGSGRHSHSRRLAMTANLFQ